MWDTSRFTKSTWTKEDGFVAVRDMWLSSNSPCLFIVIYAPQSIQKKKSLWLELNGIITINDCLTITLGGFNEVWYDSQRLGSNFCCRGAILFNDFISSTGLLEIPLGGMRFTRSNRAGNKLSKLDRFLVSPKFMERWPNAYAFTLTQEYSDHTPILFHMSSDDFGPVPFRLYKSWLLLPNFWSILF